MKNIIITSFFITLFATISFAQNNNEPVKWQYEINKIDTENYTLIVKAKIEKDWHLYGRNFDNGGPIPMNISFEKNNNYEFTGEIQESKKPTEEYDDIFKLNINYFETDVDFFQKVKLTGKHPVEVKMTIDAQACRTSNGICVPLSVEHTFIIK